MTPSSPQQPPQAAESDPLNFWSRGSLTLLSFSYAFRLCLGICVTFSSFDKELMFDGTSTSYKNIEKPLSTVFLLLSIIFSLQTYYKRGIISLLAWTINLSGAIVFANAGDYFFKMKSYEIVQSLQMAFTILTVGHAVELMHTLFHIFITLRRKREVLLILRAISPPCFAVAAYAVPLTVNFELGYGIELMGCLLIAHGIAQYVTLLCIMPNRLPTGDHGNDEEDDDDEKGRSPREPEPLGDDMLDTFTLMMVSYDPRVWNFGLMIFAMQAGLSIMILIEQFRTKETNIPLDAPPTVVSLLVSFSQFAALLLAVFWQTDILASVRMLSMLWYERDGNWPHSAILAKDGKFWTWIDKVLLPNILRLLGGILVLATSFAIIVKSEDVIELFKEFTALILISEIDNIAFRLSNQWYFGDKLKAASDRVKEIRFVDDSKHRVLWIPIRLFMLFLIFGLMLGCWSYFIHGQITGKFYLINKGLTNCTAESPLLIGDNRCNGGKYNTEECAYDGGDCEGYNLMICTVEKPYLLNDGSCDGGDYNTAECGWDKGDCEEFNRLYPNCTVEDPWKIGDGECDEDDDEDFNTEECGYDGGDCD